ncbi:MAG: Signal recognition particle receptor FtsY [Thermoanaerobacterales bacterium 50_218]|nr:MAG: Signal recognition particle receptor FtsY [Thermoanaerobacterales bacterium 50_218]HAA90203.1 signal recognition particle-docking protein FtsY [Peptococcaceae bacterium]
MGSLFSRLKQSLTKSRQGLVEKVTQLVSMRKKIDEDLFEELEEILLQADAGVAATSRLLDEIRAAVKSERIRDPQQVKDLLKTRMEEMLDTSEYLRFAETPPTVIMVVGVNGVGKTTTIGKLAFRFQQEGKRVLFAAADTFRAAAIEQLEIWAERTGAEVVKHQQGADPAAVVFDTLRAAKKRCTDVVIIDTAGRLHTKKNLMEELRKIKRITAREIPGAPHEVLLVLDATTGQNALQQARLFQEAVEVTGIALAKLDGTAKGGIILAIKEELGIPVKLVGIGEQPEDLKDFNGSEFVAALFGEEAG